jgi:hypothetical protein
VGSRRRPHLRGIALTIVGQHERLKVKKILIAKHFRLQMGNCCFKQLLPTIVETISLSEFEADDDDVADYLEDVNYRAPLATEERLEDADPLPFNYRVVANTRSKLIVQNVANEMELIYNKNRRDYRVIYIRVDNFIERNPKLWPDVHTAYVGVGSGDGSVGQLEPGLEGPVVANLLRVIVDDVVVVAGIGADPRPQAEDGRQKKN